MGINAITILNSPHRQRAKIGVQSWLMYHRLLKPSISNSFFLFGARGTGKTTLLKSLFDESQRTIIDLLNPKLVSSFQSNPENFSAEVRSIQKEWIIVDEVQKVPVLLDLVHKHIEEDAKKFILTGSSARKLKRGSANLLAGRAFVYNLFPLTHRELGPSFDLLETLSFGSLPKIFSFNDISEKRQFLYAYCDTYLKEEILVEQIIRNLPPFRRFLDVAAQMNTEQINYTAISKDIHSDPKTVYKYFSILEDTLLGFTLQPYHSSIRKRQKTAPKFYWFDTGVVRSLAGTIEGPLLVQSFEYGRLFESFVINEIHRLLSYQGQRFNLSFLRTKDDAEIDLIIERAGQPTYLIEIKSGSQIDETHVRHLQSFLPNFKNAKAYCLSNDSRTKQFGEVRALHWQQGLLEMGI